jgi:hypothetical protein
MTNLPLRGADSRVRGGRSEKRADPGLLAQLGDGARQGALDCAGRDAEQLGNLVLASVVEVPQHDDLPLIAVTPVDDACADTVEPAPGQEE